MSRLVRAAFAMVTLVTAFAAVARAPPPSLDRFKHYHWTAEDGAPAVNGLAQSSDGFLWVASPSGLFRFDGASFEKMPALDGGTDFDSVTAVAPARDGGVWVGYRDNGVARYRNGRLTDFKFPKNARQIQINKIAEGGDGVLWVAVGNGDRSLWRYAAGRWEAIDGRWGFSQYSITALIISRTGTVWITSRNALLFLPVGARRFRGIPIKAAGSGGVAEDGQGRIWYFDDGGLRLVNAPPGTRAYPIPGERRGPQAIFAADGSLWGGTRTNGIYRVASPMPAGPASRSAGFAAIDLFDQSRGLSSNAFSAVLSDREGNIWIGTGLGLDMFRPADIVLEQKLAVPTSYGDNLATDTIGNVYVGQEKTLLRIRPGGAPKRVLATAYLSALCPGRSGDVWVSLPEGVRHIHRGRSEVIPLPRMSENGGAYDCAVDRSGTLWVTGGPDGLYRRNSLGWTKFPVDSVGLNGEPTVATTDAQGRLVTQYKSNFLSIIDYPRRTAINVGGSAALNNIRTLYSGPSGLVVGGDFGLARWKNGRLHRVQATTYPWLTGIRGIAQTSGGETWLMARAGLMRLSTAELERAFAHPGRSLSARIFDSDDGMPSAYVNSDWRSLVEGGDGRLWFATMAGSAWLDPKQITRNVVPPAVLVRALVANGRRHRDPGFIELTPGTSAIEIDYTATSLSVPRRVQFRYRLLGVDDGWINPGNRREAFYTNLKPGSYSFEVIASNNDGIWNRQGATLRFSILPTFWQSWWFFAMCAIAALVLLWLVYSVRMRQVSAALRARLEERIGERERIARELHDTLLQGVQGLILRFQSIAERIPPDEPARGMMDKALDRADEIMVEGRERVSTLRSAETPSDLRHMLSDAAASATSDVHIGTRVTVQGQPRAIPSVTADEVYRIAQEALFNAVMHAQASLIEVSISFGRNALEVRITDDGVGLDQSVLDAGGRVGHYGLVGMRERAERIHAELTLSSRPGVGTEVTVAVPAGYAYVGKQRRGRRTADPEAHFGY